MVPDLIQAGFHVNLQDNEGLTLLHKAAKQSESSLITTLLRGFPELNVNLVTMSGSTALHIAIDSNRKKTMISIEGETSDKTDVWTTNTVKALLQHPFIDTNLQDEYGKTPLDLAILEGNLPVVQDLVSAGARLNLNTTTNGYGS